MKDSIPKKALEKIDKVADVMPKAEVLEFFCKLTEAYKEHQITKREIARIEAQKEIILTQIQKKYDAFYFVFNNIFEVSAPAIKCRKMAI